MPPAKPGAEETVLAYRDGDRVMTVVRIDYPNPDRKKRSMHDQVEAGVRAASVDYKRLRRRFGRVRHVVVMDLEFRRGPRKEREYVTMRFLFFRSFTLVFTAIDDQRRSTNRALAQGFTPYFAE